MEHYCAFLKGVNIGGKTMKMAEVCGVLTSSAGLTGVSSVLATGNLIFISNKPQDELRGFLEQALSTHYKKDVSLFVKSASEVSAILISIPNKKHFIKVQILYNKKE